MCGIAAIFVYREGSGLQVDDDELLAIRDHMATRGPDAQGMWRSPDGRVGLGHRRLSIIDLSEGGAQPMASADGATVVTYNGEIYNHRALRDELTARGHRFRSESDTEVLLCLYDELGTAMTEKLRGMYAFAIWDARRRCMFVARDPYGIKPLYYADDGETVRVASQVKALLAGGHVSRQLDPGGVVGFFSFGSVPEPWTRYAAIRSLPAGAHAVIDERGVGEARRAFSVAQTLTDCRIHALELSDDDIQERIADALRDSMQHHLVSDVPVGAFLSSGLDSSTLVALMSEMNATPTRTVTLGFDEFRDHPYDEAPLAALVAERYGTVHTACTIAQRDFPAIVDDVIAAMDQPSVDGINTWLVSRVAAQMGLKVAISGLGGDELFGGYPSFKQIPSLVDALRVPSRIPGLGKLLRRVGRWVYTLPTPLDFSPKYAAVLEHGGSYAGAYYLRRGLFMPWDLEELLPADFVEEGLRRFSAVDYVASHLQPDPGTAFGRVAALEASIYMRNQLLRDTDWASMAHSLEVRVPLVDSVLLSRLAPVLMNASVDAKRMLARTPTTPLPPEVITRSKTGFALPIGSWLTDHSTRLDGWRRVRALADPRCHWSRRLAYALHEQDGF